MNISPFFNLIQTPATIAKFIPLYFFLCAIIATLRADNGISDSVKELIFEREWQNLT